MSVNGNSCGIPQHEWLLVELDDALDALDPMGLVAERPRAHEYQPEIPDLIRMIVADTLTVQGITEVFLRFFGAPLHAVVPMEDVYDCVKDVADRWRAFVDRTSRSWHGPGLLWRSIWVQPVDQGDRAGTWEAAFLESTVGYIKDRFETLEGCTTLDEAVAAALRIDHDYHDELTLYGEEG